MSNTGQAKEDFDLRASWVSMSVAPELVVCPEVGGRTLEGSQHREWVEVTMGKRYHQGMGTTCRRLQWCSCCSFPRGKVHLTAPSGTQIPLRVLFSKGSY